MKTCKIEECTNRIKAKGLCGTHYEYEHRGATLGPDGAKLRAAKYEHRLTNIDPETKTGDCSKCGRVDLYFKPSTKTWECHPAKKAYFADYQLRRKYGITTEERDALLANQNGSCAICLKPLDVKSAVVDHDHTSKALRGILCSGCNVGLGFFEDSIEVLHQAAEYLKKFS